MSSLECFGTDTVRSTRIPSFDYTPNLLLYCLIKQLIMEKCSVLITSTYTLFSNISQANSYRTFFDDNCTILQLYAS